MGTMFKTGGQLLGINGSIYKFNTSTASIIKPLYPQLPNNISINDMCIDSPNNQLFVTTPNTGAVWVYSTVTLTRIATISGFGGLLSIRKDPNPVNNRVTVFDYYNSQFMFIDLTTLELSSTVIPNTYGGRGFEYDQNVGRNQILASTYTNMLTILDASTFDIVHQIVDPGFENPSKVRRNAHNLNEIYVFAYGGATNVVVMNMVDFTYSFKSFLSGAFDADADPNLPNNRIYVAKEQNSVYTASDFGFMEGLNFPNAQVVVADSTTANHRLFFGGIGTLYAAILA